MNSYTTDLVDKYKKLDPVYREFLEYYAVLSMPVNYRVLDQIESGLKKKYSFKKGLVATCSDFLEVIGNSIYSSERILQQEMCIYLILQLHKENRLKGMIEKSRSYMQKWDLVNYKVFISWVDFLCDFLSKKKPDVKYEHDFGANGSEKIITYFISTLQFPEFNGIETMINETMTIRSLDVLFILKNQYISIRYDFDSLIPRLKKAAYNLREHDVHLMTELSGMILEGKIKELGQVTGLLPEYMSFIKASILLIEGKGSEALVLFENGIKLEKKETKKPFPYEPLFLFLYVLTLIKEKERGGLDKIIALIKRKDIKSNVLIWTTMAPHTGIPNKNVASEITNRGNYEITLPLEELLLQMICKTYGLFYNIPNSYAYQEKLVKDLPNRLDHNHLIWLRQEYDSVFKDVKNQNKGIYPPLLLQFKGQEEWERVLDVLIGQEGKSTDKSKTAVELNLKRFIYLIDDYSTIEVVQQTSKNGGETWTRGRNISIMKFMTANAEELNEIDRRVISCAKGNYYNSYDLEYAPTMFELVGSPLVFLESNRDIQVNISLMQPELTIEKSGKGFDLKLNINSTNENIQVIRENNTRYRVIKLTNEQKQVLSLLNQIQHFPIEAEDKLKMLLKRLTGLITVYSDLVDTSENLKTVEGNPRIVVQLLPVGNTIRAELFVKPFVSEPPYCTPGVGAKSAVGLIEGEKLQALRNLKKEKANLEKVTNALSEIESENEIDSNLYIFEEPTQCLELMEALKDLQDISSVEWPEGAKFKLIGGATFNNLSISIKSQNNWFDIEGELKVNEDTIVSVQELMRIVGRSKSRFVELRDGEFIALTEQFRRQLHEMESLVHESKKGVQIQPIATSMLEEMELLGVNLKTDKRYKELRARIKASENMEVVVPATLMADLREYQTEGFQWMARLDAWGAGACLADDMGLGKTVQTIAMLLHKASQGPSLVIVPTSVLPNWNRELARFAPSLNVVDLSPLNDRKLQIEKAGPFDVCLLTYGVLVTEEQSVTEKQFVTVVLDEAHTIKNKETKMSKAAMKLKAEFRVILTGTPIQNHLGEVWNLFHFINPGLLGTFESFKNRYITPIVEHKDKEQQKRLKRVLTPFLLRRTKNSVLDELPPKTEIIKNVELTQIEMAAYELIRRQAEEAIKEGSNPMQTLSEITKLRMAACNIGLVNKDFKIQSSKINTFLEIVEELQENNHRALVFSQFTTHLSLVKEALDNAKIPYLYLDGSTIMKDRERLVKEFQTGEIPLFLISLKAGGLGLNLTAADFVIHLDPWWNPAIENQASDRAHRMGQTRPVTIYRLIADQTIEEKIIRLHSTKKDLADSLLEGSDISHKLTREELMELLAD